MKIFRNETMCIIQNVLAFARTRACVHIIVRMCLSHSVLEKLIMELGIQNYEVVCCRNENMKDINFTLSGRQKAFEYNMVKKDGMTLFKITM